MDLVESQSNESVQQNRSLGVSFPDSERIRKCQPGRKNNISELLLDGASTWSTPPRVSGLSARGECQIFHTPPGFEDVLRRTTLTRHFMPEKCLVLPNIKTNNEPEEPGRRMETPYFWNKEGQEKKTPSEDTCFVPTLG